MARVYARYVNIGQVRYSRNEVMEGAERWRRVVCVFLGVYVHIHLHKERDEIYVNAQELFLFSCLVSQQQWSSGVGY